MSARNLKVQDRYRVTRLGCVCCSLLDEEGALISPCMPLKPGRST